MRYLRAALAVPWVLAAAFAVARRFERLPLDELAGFLCREMTLPKPVRDPRLLSAVAWKLHPWLPPHRMGPCLKRSLILIRLWSGCGLRPRLHLGVRKTRADTLFHAWVSVDGHPELTAGDSGYAEVFAFARNIHERS